MHDMESIPENLEWRVLDSFHTEKIRWSGIVLSICRSIIEVDGGRLWPESNQPRGALFQFSLPEGIMTLSAVELDRPPNERN